MSALVILVSAGEQEALLRAAFLGAGFAVRTPLPAENSLGDWISLARTGDAPLLAVDPKRLSAAGVHLGAVATAIRHRVPDAAVAAVFGERERVQRPTRAWGERHGLLGMFGRVRKAQLARTAGALLDAATHRIGSRWQPERVQQFARALITIETGDDALAAHGFSDDLIDGLSETILDECMDLADRRWRLKSYPSCFVGIDAVSQIARKLSLDRAAATAFGQRLLERGYIYHVAGDHPFRDGNFYYRVHRQSVRLDSIELDAADVVLRQRVAVADRIWRGLSFPQCFIGSEAREVLREAFALDFTESVTLGQALLEAHAFRHVADAHDFFGTDYFYRFADEVRR